MNQGADVSHQRLPAKRVLILPKYARNGASSRYRSLQYLPILEELGLDCETAPLFDEEYLVQRYAGRRLSAWRILTLFLRRLSLLLVARRFDLVFLEKEFLPYFPAVPERMLRWMHVPYVADYDDALFHQYDHNRRWLVRSLLGGKIAAVMRNAAAVTVGNGYLGAYAERAGARRVERIPTVIDLVRYPVAGAVASDPRGLVIGWIGSPSTTPYLEAIAEPLAQVCRRFGARVHLIGAGDVNLPGIPLAQFAWNEDDEVERILAFDVGIMPLPDQPWERGKCGLKLIQYMGCGLPVVASPVGANREIVEPGVNGYLAESAAQWVEALAELLTDGTLRHRLGQAGRSKVERRYALQVTGPQLARILASVAGRG